MSSLTHGELFAGVSGFALGFEKHGIKTAWCVEKDANCRKVLRRHHPHAVIRDDVCTSGAANLPRVDIISFGSPCQDLSVAGKRKGLAGGRSGLFYEAVRIITELRPALAVWENVPGALSSNGGRDFGCVIDALADAGAVDIGWRVLDARYFGVPQRRRRIFLVADFAGRRADEILALSDSLRGYPAPRRKARQGAPRGIESGIDQSGRVYDVDGVAPTLGHHVTGGAEGPNNLGAFCPEVAYALTSRNAQDRPESGAATLIAAPDSGLVPETAYALRAYAGALRPEQGLDTVIGFTWQSSFTGAAEETAPTLRVGAEGSAVCFEPGNLSRRCGSEPNEMLAPKVGASSQGDKFPCVAHTVSAKWAKGTGGPSGDECQNLVLAPPVMYENHGQDSRIKSVPVSPALSQKAGTGGGNLPLVQTAYQVRRLTPVECERLQGFPDDHTAWGLNDSGDHVDMADSTRYRMCGNAVCAAVSDWLGRQISVSRDRR